MSTLPLSLSIFVLGFCSPPRILEHPTSIAVGREEPATLRNEQTHNCIFYCVFYKKTPFNMVDKQKLFGLYKNI